MTKSKFPVGSLIVLNTLPDAVVYRVLASGGNTLTIIERDRENDPNMARQRIDRCYARHL